MTSEEPPKKKVRLHDAMVNTMLPGFLDHINKVDQLKITDYFAPKRNAWHKTFAWGPFWDVIGAWLKERHEKLKNVFYFVDRGITPRSWGNAFSEIKAWNDSQALLTGHKNFKYGHCIPPNTQVHKHLLLQIVYYKDVFAFFFNPSVVFLLPSDEIFAEDDEINRKNPYCVIGVEWMNPRDDQPQRFFFIPKSSALWDEDCIGDVVTRITSFNYDEKTKKYRTFKPFVIPREFDKDVLEIGFGKGVEDIEYS